MPIIRIEIPVERQSGLEKDIVIRVNLADASIVINDGPASPSQKQVTLRSLLQQAIERFQGLGKQRTAETYKSTLNSIDRFLGGRDILISELTGDLMQAYEAKMRSENIALNTSSFYMRKLRAVYNRAVADGLVKDTRPFRNVYTSMEGTRKRAVSIETIRMLKDYAPESKAETLARALFLFSFYTRGMAFVDMAHLRKSDLSGGYLTYTRRKTGQQLTVRWEKDMQDVTDQLTGYAGAESPFLLPIIRNNRSTERGQYRGMQLQVNKALKKISEKLHLDRKLTLYVSRHSWASIARQTGVPTSVISQALGHTSEKTTQIYLKALDKNVIDEANRSIIGQLHANN